MSQALIKLELTPADLDLIFFGLQNSPLPVSFVVAKDLMDRINEQGQPQLQAMAVESEGATND
jgi:hypothetical protein